MNCHDMEFSTIIVGKLRDNPHILPHLLTQAHGFLSNTNCHCLPPPARPEAPPDPSTSSHKPKVHGMTSHQSLQYLQQVPMNCMLKYS